MNIHINDIVSNKYGVARVVDVGRTRDLLMRHGNGIANMNSLATLWCDKGAPARDHIAVVLRYLNNAYDNKRVLCYDLSSLTVVK